MGTAHLLELRKIAKTAKPSTSRPHTQYQRQATASPSKVSTFILKLVNVDLNSLPRHLNRTSVSVLRAFFHAASAAFFAHLNLLPIIVTQQRYSPPRTPCNAAIIYFDA